MLLEVGLESVDVGEQLALAGLEGVDLLGDGGGALLAELVGHRLGLDQDPLGAVLGVGDDLGGLRPGVGDDVLGRRLGLLDRRVGGALGQHQHLLEGVGAVVTAGGLGRLALGLVGPGLGLGGGLVGGGLGPHGLGQLGLGGLGPLDRIPQHVVDLGQALVDAAQVVVDLFGVVALLDLGELDVGDDERGIHGGRC